MSVCDFSKQNTAKERRRSLVSRMGDGEEYLETPLPLPQSMYGWMDGRSLARTLASKPNFLGLMGYQFFLPMVLRWRAWRPKAPLLGSSRNDPPH